MKSSEISPALIFRLLFKPSAAFEGLSMTRPAAYAVFFRLTLWLILLPPAFILIGSSTFGWRLGGAEPLFFSSGTLVAIGVAYFLALLFGFVSSAFLSRWMASTQGARPSLGIHFALLTIIATPLSVGSVIHVYPNVFINILVLVPTLIWSIYLLFRGLPIVLEISHERGMRIASALIGYLIIAAISLLGLMVVL